MLRVVAYSRTPLGDPPATVEAIRALRPDIAVVIGGPRRLRWRTRAADLANRLGLLYAAGGEPALGNLILVRMRVTVPEAVYLRYPLVPGRLMQGAAVIRACVAGRGFTVVGTRLSPYADERPAQAAALAAELDRRERPAIVAADVGCDGDAWQTLARGRTAVGAAPASGDPERSGHIMIFTDPPIEILRHEWVPLPRARTAEYSDPGPALLAELRLPV